MDLIDPHVRKSLLTGLPPAALQQYPGALPADDDKDALLEQALQRLAQQDRVLAFFEEKWLSAQNDIELLMDSQARSKERIARLKDYARNLYRHALHDETTDLPNRRLIVDRLSHAIAQAQRHKGQVGVIVLATKDLPGLISLHGQDLADRTLREFGRRMRHALRASDTFGRYGKDRFVAVLSELHPQSGLDPVLAKLHARLVAPIIVDKHVMRLPVDFGCAVYPVHGEHSVELIQHACADVEHVRKRHDEAAAPENRSANRAVSGGAG